MSISTIHPQLPPNILIFTDEANEFNKLKDFIQSILGKNSYTIYNLTHNELQKSSTWIPSCTLLVTSETFNLSDQILNEKGASFKNFINSGGKILSVPSLNDNLERGHRKFDDKHNIYFRKEKFLFESFYDNVFKKTPWKSSWHNFEDLFFTYKSENSSGVHFVSKTFIETDDQESKKFIQNLYTDLLENYFKLARMDVKQLYAQNSEKYVIFSKNKLLQSVNVIDSYLNGSMKKEAKLDLNSTQSEFFNHKEYFSNLKTKSIGTIIMYSNLVESTMNSITNLPSSLDNIVILARQQTQGQGNNKNEWLSPIGCCMSTLNLNLNSNTFSTSRICLLQFAAALSCVKSIKSLPGCKDVPIGIKWPNDIYYDRRVKLGGVLVKSSLMGTQIGLKIGVGLNISNQHPTVCLNSILREYKLEECSHEIYLSSYFNYFEYYLNMLSESNFNSWLKFRDDFQQNWIHKNQKVRVNFWDEEVEIIGVNEFGYLKVKRSDETEHCLQPDGNRFDLMQNLIVLR